MLKFVQEIQLCGRNCHLQVISESTADAAGFELLPRQLCLPVAFLVPAPLLLRHYRFIDLAYPVHPSSHIDLDTCTNGAGMFAPRTSIWILAQTGAGMIAPRTAIWILAQTVKEFLQPQM